MLKAELRVLRDGLRAALQAGKRDEAASKLVQIIQIAERDTELTPSAERAVEDFCKAFPEPLGTGTARLTEPDAGATQEELRDFLAEAHLLFPDNPSAEELRRILKVGARVEFIEPPTAQKKKGGDGNRTRGARQPTGSRQWTRVALWTAAGLLLVGALAWGLGTCWRR